MSTPNIISVNKDITSLVPLLPGLLSIKGKAFTLDNHFPFAPMFSTNIIPYLTLRAARQVGKSQQLTALLCLRSVLRDYYRAIVILPLLEQSDRLSVEYFRPIVEDSPVCTMLRKDGRVGSVRRYSFSNGAIVNFLYAWLSAERVRGNVGNIYLDEAQDILREHIPVIDECKTAQPQATSLFSGTSKTLDTCLEENWAASSQGIWHIRCGCGFDNICCIEPEGHLFAMLGPARPDISEARPGLICKHCSRPISPRTGRWVHRKPDRLSIHLGLHLPQPIFPLHYSQPDKWRDLLRKRDNYPKGKFINEILGEPWDFAVKLVSESDLRKAGTLGPNTLENALNRRNRSGFCVVGVDWGAGGEEAASRTKLAVALASAEGLAHIVYGKEFPVGTDAVEETLEVLKIAAMFKADVLAHDYNGAGAVRESILTHGNWPLERIAPFVYNATPGKPIIDFVPAKGGRIRGYYTLNKGKALQYTCLSIRQGLIQTFDYDHINIEQPGLLYDFTALVEDKVDSPTGVTHYRVRKSMSAQSDDFAQAVNMAVCALWQTIRPGDWPGLTSAFR